MSFYSPLTREQNPKQKIPRILSTTLNTRQRISSEVHDCIRNNKDINPEYAFYCYDDKDCLQFLSEHFPKRVRDAFEKLNPGAFKSDLFRYCLLYIQGGVYIDANKRLLKPLHQLIQPDTEMVLVMDRRVNIIGWNVHPDPMFQSIFQSFIATVPRHPFLQSCIEKSVENIENNYYGKTPLDITGPSMMGYQFYHFYGKWLHQGLMSNSFIVLKHDRVGRYVKDVDGQKVIHAHMPNKRKNQKRFWKQDYYGIAWKKRMVYKTAK
jgi:mannosyltransferase OCH1-like enzyme